MIQRAPEEGETPVRSGEAGPTSYGGVTASTEAYQREVHAEELATSLILLETINAEPFALPLAA